MHRLLSHPVLSCTNFTLFFCVASSMLMSTWFVLINYYFWSIPILHVAVGLVVHHKNHYLINFICVAFKLGLRLFLASTGSNHAHDYMEPHRFLCETWVICLRWIKKRGRVLHRGWWFMIVHVETLIFLYKNFENKERKTWTW